jgi:hypothetical protein
MTLVYTVGATFPDAALAAEWLRWLREGHVAAVLAGGAADAEVTELDEPAHSFEVRYHFPSRAAFDRYLRDHAPALRAEGLRLFPPEKGVTYRRSVALVVQSYPSKGAEVPGGPP